MDFWDQFPEEKAILKAGTEHGHTYNVNAHIHTPYSFSAFESVEQAVDMSVEEGIGVLGINDFLTADGFAEWAETCLRKKVFPLFNMEFTGLSKQDQKRGIPINDPENPGRVYLSGKGMKHPFSLNEPYSSLLSIIQHRSNRQTEAICHCLNRYLEEAGVDILLVYEEIRDRYTRGMVRERHLAKALRMAVFDKVPSDTLRKEVFARIFQDKVLRSPIDDISALENEIRTKLFKAGGAVFVRESPEMFPDLENLRNLILTGGGIPTYPLLADAVKGGYTEFEGDKENLYRDLVDKGFFSIEFVTNRTSAASLEEYSAYFSDKGFVITFGSEHNTPRLFPLRLTSRSGEELSDHLKRINYLGACLIAAHQYRVAKTGFGYLREDGTPETGRKAEFEELGRHLLEYYFANSY